MLYQCMSNLKNFPLNCIVTKVKTKMIVELECWNDTKLSKNLNTL
jgi:hypothetical protein